MSKLKHSIWGILTVLFAVCCVSEEESLLQEKNSVEVAFRPCLDEGLPTRVIGDATNIDQLRVAVYEGDRHIYTITESWNYVQQNGISLNLMEGLTYKILFWAQDKDNTAYSFKGDGTIAVDYSNYTKRGHAVMEELDAFYAVTTVVAGSKTAGDNYIVLSRPLAQLNFADDAIRPENGSHKAIITFHSIPSYFNPFSGEVKMTDTVDGSDDITFSFTDFPEELLYSEGKQYHYISCNYLLAPADGFADVAVTFEIQKDGEQINRFEFKGKKAIIIERNKKTNVLGSIVQKPASWSIWDGTIPSTCPLTQASGNMDCYIIDEADDIAWLSVRSNAEQIGKGKTLMLTENIDMVHYDGQNPLYLPEGTVFNGGGKTIKGLKLKEGFLGNISAVTVTDLDIDQAIVSYSGSSESHRGVLANIAYGSCTFRNVTVKNSSVSTASGAAGGMVGYIMRKDKHNRDEKADVIFDNCHVRSTTVDGTLSEGHFVGKFCGYDNGESLTFTPECTLSNDGQTSLKSSYIEGNEGDWLSGNNYSKYNAWLGDEEYYRGKVIYGSNRFIPKWDGKTIIEPFLADPEYDDDPEYKVTAGDSRYVVYSAFDLAGVRNKTATPAAIYFKESVDMNGQGKDGKFFVPEAFSKSRNSSSDDNHFKSFSTVGYIDGQNNSIYNLSIYSQYNAGFNLANDRAAFIINALGTTVHKNISLHNCRTAVPHVVKDNEDKSYGAAFVSHVAGTSYTMQNVHAYGCKVFALQKVGILAARLAATSSDVSGCTVNNCYIENYECKDHYEEFSAEKSVNLGITTIDAKLSAKFYSYGEIGGLIGYVENNSTISDCHVRNSTIDAYGQDDQNAEVSPTTAAIGVSLLGYYVVPGRHVSTLIGDIRTTDSEKETIRITDCTVDSSTKCVNRHDRHNNKCGIVGRAYFLEFKDSEGSVYFNGTKLTLMNCKKSQDRDQ